MPNSAAADRPEMTGAGLLLLLLLLASRSPSPATGHDGATTCPMNASEPAPEGAHLLDGVLWANELSYQPSAYRTARDGHGYVLCTCEIKPCVRKCCGPGKIYELAKKCTKSNTHGNEHVNFTIPKYVNRLGMVEKYEADKFGLVYADLKCKYGKSRLNPRDEDNEHFRISETGLLLNKMNKTIATAGQFCLEQFSDVENLTIPLVCNPNTIPINMYYTIGMVLSLPFLFSTFLVYALVKELRNLHGKSLMCHVATLFVAYSSLIIIQLATSKIDQIVCVIFAYIIQFSFLASFFWLNVMCFDLWWTFSGYRPLRGHLKEYESKKFIIYSMYAWGCTSIISIFTYYMELSSSTSSAISRPEFGEQSCWFSSKMAKLIYFYGPIIILLFSNLLMFIYTAIMIIKNMNHAKVLNGSESTKNVNHEKQRFMLYLKLFIVMGVNWSAEIISFAFDFAPEYIWYVTDIGNTLQGVLIFLIFVCKKRVLRLVNKKICPQLKLFKTSISVSTVTTNSSIYRNSSQVKDVAITFDNLKNSTNNEVYDFKA